MVRVRWDRVAIGIACLLAWAALLGCVYRVYG